MATRRSTGPARAVVLLTVGMLVLAACQPTGGGGRNHLGSGQLFSGAIRENAWLAISGPCASAEQGELLATVSQANYATPNNPPTSSAYVGCTPGAGGTVEANPDHQPLGYTYTLAIPPSYAGGPLDVSIFDAGYCGGSSAAGDQSGGGFTTTFELAGPVTAQGAPVVASFEQLGASSCVRSCEAGGPGMWCPLYAIAEPVPGSTYVLNVRTSADDLAASGQHGSNHFSLRFHQPGSSGLCSAHAGDTGYDPDCPEIRADGWAGYFLRFGYTSPSFSVARLPESSAGKVLRVWLWDVGEGSDRVRLLDPALQARTFDWQVVDRSGTDVAPTGGWSGSTATLDVSGSGHPQPGPGRLSSSRYNDRLLVLDVALDPAEAVAGEWRLQVLVGQAPTDRLTLRTEVVAPGTPLPPRPDLE